jgi:hypothetical protein
MTLARWFTAHEYGFFPIERAALGACDLSVLHVGGEWQWLVRRDGHDVAEGAARACPRASRSRRAHPPRGEVMQLDLDDVETRALLNVLVEAIENDRYPLSPRVRLLRQVLAKFGPMAPAPPPPARPPTPEERDPGRAPRFRSGRRSR